MKQFIRYFSRVSIYSVIAYSIIFCLRQPINAQAPGGRAIKYYGVDTRNITTDADYSLLASHAVKTAVIDTSISSSTVWNNIINMATKYNMNIVIWPNQGGDVSGCGWETPFNSPQNGDYIWRVKPMLDIMGGNSHIIGIVIAHEAPWNQGSCRVSITDMAAVKTQIKDYIYSKFGRTDFKVWNYIGNISDMTNIVDYSGVADIGKIMDVAVIWLHCFGGAEGTCEQAEQRILNGRAAIKNAGLEGKVELLYLFQTFAMGSGYRMPTLSEMQAWDCRFINTGAIDGFMWYTWGACWYASDLYCPAATHPNQNLWPEMNRVYDTCVNVGTNPSPTPTPTSGLKPGDANGDGRVDGLDYVIWLNHFGQSTTAGPSAGDFNRSGKIDGLDYVVWLNNFGT